MGYDNPWVIYHFYNNPFPFPKLFKFKLSSVLSPYRERGAKTVININETSRGQHDNEGLGLTKQPLDKGGGCLRSAMDR